MDVGENRRDTETQAMRMKSKLKFNFPQGITCVFITPAYSGFPPEFILSWGSLVVMLQGEVKFKAL